MDDAAAAEFIRANTRLLAPPLTPEIRLHLACESIPIWQKTEEELGAINVPPPFWAFAWAGGQALARYVLDHPELVAGRRVLDAGSGSGLVAIAGILAGAASAVAVDIDALAVAAIQLNAAANDVEVAAIQADPLETPPTGIDVLLVGDLFYEQDLGRRVLDWIEIAARNGVLVLIGDPRRSYFPTARFIELGAYNVPVTRELEDVEIKRTAVWRLAG